MEKMRNIPRVMLCAPGSGSGKTLLTCGILTALKERGLAAASFKCGPDFIDPMFHTTVIGTPSRNLDTFFTGPELTRYLFSKSGKDADVAVIEGVMGFYDGLGGTSLQASSWELASVLEAPAVLIVNARGMSRSIIPLIKGFADYSGDGRIKGVILNQVSGMLYDRLAEMIRSETGLIPLGYVPRNKDLALESRHLGLVLPEEVEGIREKLHALAQMMEKTLDLDGLLELAETAPVLPAEEPEEVCSFREQAAKLLPGGKERPVIAVASDEAFCFLYRDNLELLEGAGAKLTYFSPLHDRTLPEADGLLLCGGYPELHAEELCANGIMRAGIRQALGAGMPFLAECGGFMYLQKEMEDAEGKVRPGAGVFNGRSFPTGSLGRFGYITLAYRGGEIPAEEIPGGPLEVRGHEFHYYDTTDNGTAFHAVKGAGGRSWDCMHADERSLAGFPHLYYWSNPRIVLDFVRKCAGYHEERTAQREEGTS